MAPRMGIRSVVTGRKENAALFTGYEDPGIRHVDDEADGEQYCGKTTGHCGEGCQSGPCLGPAVKPAPGPQDAPTANPGGAFRVVGQAGVPAMHAGLLPNGRVVFLDKVEDYSQIKLGNGQYAYSAEYDPATNTRVGLSYKVMRSCVSVGFGNRQLIEFRPTPSVRGELSSLTDVLFRLAATLLSISSILRSVMGSKRSVT